MTALGPSLPDDSSHVAATHQRVSDHMHVYLSLFELQDKRDARALRVLP